MSNKPCSIGGWLVISETWVRDMIESEPVPILKYNSFTTHIIDTT